MEPLSVAASIISVAGAIYAVSQKLRRFAKTLAHAATEVKYIAKEMSTFSTLLRALRNIFQTVTPVVLGALNLSKICDDLVQQAKENVGEFNQFLADLEPLRDSIDANIIAKTMARLRWNSRKTDLVLLRSKLDSSKLTLNLCVTIIHTRVATEELGASQRRARKDKAEIDDLHGQMCAIAYLSVNEKSAFVDTTCSQLLSSQLASERSNVRDAISVSRKLEYQISGPGARSVNQIVAKHALKLAKTQQIYAEQQYQSSMEYTAMMEEAAQMRQRTLQVEQE